MQLCILYCNVLHCNVYIGYVFHFRSCDDGSCHRTQAFELEPFGDLGDFDYEEEGFEEVEDGFDETHEVIIPDGLKEGDAFIAVVGDEEFRVTVPAGFKPGDSLLLDVDPPSDPSDFPSDSKEAPRGLPSSDSKDQDSKAHSKPAKLKPKRQVSFTEQEPSVMLFSPDLGGLSLDAESPPDFGAADFLDLIIPDHASAGDVLEVQSDSGQTIEVVVPDGAEAGMTLTVMSPTGKHAGFEELSFTDQSPQEEQDESLHKRSQQAEQIEVVIPDHASAGDVLEVQSESGQTIEVVVPEGAEAGMTLTVESPASKDGKMDKFPDNPAFVAEAPENAHDESLDTQNQKTERINIIVAHGDACAETVLEVESHSGNKDEAVVPDGAEARVTLTVESPTNKDGKMDRFPDDPAFVAESPEKAHDESLEQTERINIVVPDDASAGDVLEVESDSGTKIEVVVPEGIEAGTTVTVESPTNKDGKMERFPDDPAFVAESPEKAHDGSLEQTERINIVVPDDASAGDVLEVESDSGTKIEVVVPEGIEAGMTVTVESPTNKDGKMERFPDNPAFVAESPEKAHDESLEQTERINIVVPDDASAGDVLEVESDSGNKIEVVVPEGIEAGMTLTVESPTNKDGKMERFPDDPAFVAESPEKAHDESLEQTERINIVVPDDASAGDVLEVESDSGNKIEVVVPEGIEAGMTLTVESPTNKDGKMERFPDNPAFVAESPEKAHDESLEQTERINIVVPDDASAGDVLEVESDSGNKIEVVVPEGIEAGMTLTVESPTNKDGKMERFPDDPAFVAEQLHEHQVEEEGPTAALDRDCMALGGTYEAGGEQKQGAETAMTQSSKGVSQETDSTVKDSSSSSLSQGADTARHQRCETSGDTPGTPSFLELKASQSERPPPRCASSVPQVQANSIATQPRRVPEESTHRLSENQRRATATANSPNTARQPAKPTHVPFSEVPTKGSIPLKEGETGKGPDGMEMRRWLTSESGQIDLERRGAGRSSTKTKANPSEAFEAFFGQSEHFRSFHFAEG